MKNFIRIAVVFLVLGMLSACGDGNGDNGDYVTIMYGTTIGSADSTDPLVLLNANTGAYIRTVGPTGYYVNGLAYDKTTGKLFATTSATDFDIPPRLIEINTATGEGTPIGEGFGLLEGGESIVCLTVNASGQLYGWREPEADSLVTINKVTGEAAQVGSAELVTQALGLDFNAQGDLILVNGDGQIYEIDPTTGAASLPIGDIGVMAHHGKFHPTTGLYWGIDTNSKGNIDNPDRKILEVDIPASIIEYTLSPRVDYLHTIAFVPR
ncbi:MAG: DUF4394 domain-containing protein [Deltaproteobacteria bacterium]|nr:DUF4394 domain-containing protein [Deltaproteobacteria bacterium]